MGDSGRPGDFDREEYIRRKKEEIMASSRHAF